MENVNKIEIRLDSITTTAATITIPFGLDFFPVDNTELQQVEFVEKEIEKAVNPIFDHEKYPFYPSFPSTIGTTPFNDAYTVDFEIANTYISYLGLTLEDLSPVGRNAFKKTYLRLNFYDSRDLKTQRLLARETVHLQILDSWFTNGTLNPLNVIPLIFRTNFQNLFYNSRLGEGYNFYWYKDNLPKKLYMSASIMNAKTGKVINLYSNFSGPLTSSPINPLSVAVTSAGLNYVECEFYSDLMKKQQYYYVFNTDNLSQVNVIEDLLFPLNNKITILFNPY